MLDLPVTETLGDRAGDVLPVLMTHRLQYDFELWCYMGVRIRTKDGTIMPLLLNRPQRRYAELLMNEFFARRPLRIVLLKARQWGGSTLTQAFFAWVQLYHRSGWNAAVVTDVQDQARHILGMYRTLAEHYPMGSITFSSYRGAQNVQYVQEADAYVGVASVQNPNAVRSYTYHMLHLSEVGLWPSTEVTSAEDLAQSLLAGLPERPYTACVMESTAKGVGNYFHKKWQQAERGESNFKPLFVPWFEIEDYRLEVEEKEAFVESWDKYEQMLWTLGATIEGIAWYRRKSRDFPTRWRMQSEFPSTAAEAFQSTGDRYFSAPAVLLQRESNVRRPALMARIRSKAETGRDALRDIRFEEDENGPVWIWTRPEEDPYKLIGSGRMVKNRFAAFADFGGKTDKADWSVVTIADRLPMLRGGVPEIAARYRAHLRPDLFAWDAAKLARAYDIALLAYEVNRHRHDRGDKVRGYEPEWSLAVLDEIRGVYPNLYLRVSQSRADEKVDMEIGFHTNTSTKPMILNVMDKALEEEGYVERDERACDEMDTFEKKPDGTLGAVDGCNDDIIISTAGTLWLALSHMEPVSEFTPRTKAERKAVGAAIFG